MDVVAPWDSTTSTHQSGVGRRAARAGVAPACCFVVALLLYVRTAAPTIYALDSSGLTRAAYLLVPAHSPGYPLYLLLGKAFITLVPWGDAGYRLNLMSAVFGATAAALLCVFLRTTGHRTTVSVGASLVFATGFYFWSTATMAEVYTLNTALVALLLVLLVQWRRTGRERWLGALALVYGLSFGDHVTVALLFPGLAFAILRAAPRHRPARIRPSRLLLLFALGLGVYAFVPLRGHFVSARALVDFVAARGFWHAVFDYDAPEYLRQVVYYARDLWASFLGVGLVIGLIGIPALWRRDRDLCVALGLMFAANLLFFSGYRVADRQLMVVHTYLLWTVWVAAGAQDVGDFADHAMSRSGRRTVVAGADVAGAMLLALAGLSAVVNYPHADLSADWRVRDRAEQVLHAVQPHALVLVESWVDQTPLLFLQDVEGQRLDVSVENVQFYPPGAPQTLIADSVGQRPVYTIEPIALANDALTVAWVDACRCYRVTRRAGR
jgi:hypothetical protein